MTAIILSHEEAMALPQAQRPMNYRVTSKIYHDVFEAIGAASMCWNPRPGSQVFESEEASKVAVELLFKIAEELERLGITSDMVRESRRARYTSRENAVWELVDVMPDPALVGMFWARRADNGERVLVHQHRLVFHETLETRPSEQAPAQTPLCPLPPAQNETPPNAS